ncbi:MAG: hypothetical protein CM15mP46_2230 [Alphaproteobacteria bacterium]|nr:MAG: hypothetical protein CM15mP46_2230 [Alphaproteobacteria bacterium]
MAVNDAMMRGWGRARRCWIIENFDFPTEMSDAFGGLKEWAIRGAGCPGMVEGFVLHF